MCACVSTSVCLCLSFQVGIYVCLCMTVYAHLMGCLCVSYCACVCLHVLVCAFTCVSVLVCLHLSVCAYLFMCVSVCACGCSHVCVGSRFTYDVSMWLTFLRRTQRSRSNLEIRRQRVWRHRANLIIRRHSAAVLLKTSNRGPIHQQFTNNKINGCLVSERRKYNRRKIITVNLYLDLYVLIYIYAYMISWYLNILIS